jgi:ABC-type nitrate/sulfonate/bicarbonate transport system substrate-binding protein
MRGHSLARSELAARGAAPPEAAVDRARRLGQAHEEVQERKAMPITRRAALAASLAAPALARAQAPARLRVIVFAGLANLPLFAALHTGALARRGIEVEITNTPNSGELRNGLAAGRYDIAHGGVDNAVAMFEGGARIGILLGGDSAFNSLFAKPGIERIADLRGRTLIVDAPDTAYALVAYRMLDMAGLPRGSYEVRPTGGTAQRFQLMMNDATAHASMLNPPFSVMGADGGLRDLGDATSVIGPYLGNAGWAMREWSAANQEVLGRYLAGYVEGIRWMLAPANAEAAASLLAERLRLAPEIARRSHALLVAPGTGSAVDGRFDMEGFRAVLRLRAEVLGNWGGTPPAPDRYLDLGHWERSVRSLA